MVCIYLLARTKAESQSKTAGKEGVMTLIYHQGVHV